MTSKSVKKSARTAVARKRAGGSRKKVPAAARSKASAGRSVVRRSSSSTRPFQQQQNKAPSSVRMPWAQLGWRLLRGEFRPDDGPLRVLVVAPWCPDCVKTVPSLAPGLLKGRTIVVGEFSESREIAEFCEKSGVSQGVPLLAGTDAKTEPARIEARFRQLRSAFGDARKWGVPTLLEGRLENGVFVAEKFSDPSA